MPDFRCVLCFLAAPLARRCLLAALLLALLVGCPRGTRAQAGAAGRAYLQGAVAAVPGVGLNLGYVRAHTFYTVEGVLYTEGSPAFIGDAGRLHLSGGLGGALRPLGVVRLIGNAAYVYDVDLGFRFGPSLLFTSDATRADKNQQFSLFLDPFLRFVTRLGGGRIVFAEVGTRNPSFRAGLWLRF